MSPKEDIRLLSISKDSIPKDEEKKMCMESKGGAPSLWRDTSRREKCILSLLSIATFAVYFTVSIPGTFLARVVVERGELKVFAVIIMQSSFLFAGVSSLICGIFQSRIGCKKCLVFGLGLVTVCQAASSFLNYLTDNAAFIACGTVIKSLQGIGLGIMSVTSLAILFQELPDHMEKAFGIVQSAMGVGFLLGPVVGSLLYSIEDRMIIPFLVSSVPTLFLTVACWIGLNEISVEEQSVNYRIRDYISKPSVIFVMGVTGACSGVYAAYDVTFTTYLQTMDISVINAGWIMLAGDVFYAIGGTVAGYLSSLRNLIRRLTLLFSFIGFAVAVYAFIPSQPEFAIYIETASFGLFGSIVSTTAFMEIMNTAPGEDETLKSNLTFQSKLSGAWCFLVSMTSFAIPLLSSGLQSLLSYHISQILSLAASISVGCLISLIAIIFRNETELRRYSALK